MIETTENRIIGSLSSDVRKEALAHCERLTLKAETPLWDIGDAVDRLYFPETSVISIVSAYIDGSTIELGNVGREGCTGVTLLLGSSEHLVSGVAQVSGRTLMMNAKAFSHLRATMPSFDAAVSAAAQGMLYQIMISGACNLHHSAKQRLARWLMTMRNRSGADVIDLTQDFLAQILGVRRATVSHALTEFRTKNLVLNSRGRIEVIDPRGLTNECCECYGMVREAYGRLFDTVPR